MLFSIQTLDRPHPSGLQFTSYHITSTVTTTQDCSGLPDSMSAAEHPASIGDHSDLADKDVEQTYPRLPPEIEIEIFIVAFDTQKKHRTTLLCVAKRVRDWLIPLIYNTIVIDLNYTGGPMLSALQQYGHHVQQVFAHQYPSESEQTDLFTYCPNIWNLGLWCTGTLSEAVYKLKGLRRLALDFYGFESLREEEHDGTVQPSIPIDIQKVAWFSNITHLVTSEITTIASSIPLRRLPNLTHFMILSLTPRDVLRHILQSYPKLKVVVWLLGHVTDENKVFVLDSHSDDAPKINDKRIVTMNARFSENWIRAAKGDLEKDLWVIAERTVEERRRGV
ncbi:hypothetical protein BDN72DRAFT_834203 [Pluteus cervinus]|uniref:Uncharacterized protein n=1 Tax=Pluteus cervinus TaxID=181527 RepID=A0ACD3B717_9AGAR|nr:hypothetical protein BDN72DRAFT_834203 [Pluteus cervinus]